MQVFFLFERSRCIGQIILHVVRFFSNFVDLLFENLFSSVQLPEVGDALADDLVQSLVVVRGERGKVDHDG